MPQDETSEIDLDSRLTQSEALAAALAEDDGDGGGDDDGFDSPSIDRPSAKELRTTLGRRQEPEDVEDDEEEEEVEEEVEAPAEEVEDESQGDDLTAKVFEKLKGKIDVSKYQSVDDFLEGVVHLSRKLGERDQIAAYGQQMLDDPLAVYNHLQNYLTQSGKLPKQEQQAAQNKPLRSDIPEYDEKWHDVLFKADGTLKEDADPAIARKYANWQEWMVKESRRLVSNPTEYLRPLLQEEMAKIAKQTAGEEIGKVRAEQEQYARLTAAQRAEYETAQSLLVEDAQWIFKNPQNWKEGLTPAGQEFKKWVEYAEQPLFQGGPPRIPDVKDRREYAKAKAYEALTSVQKKDNKAPRKELQERAGKKPVRAGTKRPKSFFAGKTLEQALMEGLGK